MLPNIVIAGPTATGKTAVAIALSKRLGGEIISADSMQIYKFMDIGTAKPTLSEQDGIPHYLMDEITPDTPFSAFDFCARAEEAIKDIRTRGKQPIIAGGTGFYLNALIKANQFVEMDTDHDYRAELWAFAEEHSNAALHARLAEVDPISARAIHENNVKRVIRALEYHKLTGKPISSHNAKERAREAKTDYAVFILTDDRQKLYERIEIRVDKMLENGLIDEVARLKSMGYARSLTSMRGIGYKEVWAYLDGEITLEQAIYDIKINTRHMAKRQLTWFGGQMRGMWLDIRNYKDADAIAAQIIESLERV